MGVLRSEKQTQPKRAQVEESHNLLFTAIIAICEGARSYPITYYLLLLLLYVVIVVVVVVVVVFFFF